MSKTPFYITTPIYYPSGNPHIGHCYTTVACDSIARYKRMQGHDVMFLTGTDEHGLKIEQKATEKGVTPKQYVDEIVDVFKKLWKYMNIDYDRYIRTTDDYHVESVQKIFKALYDKGYIYKGEYSGKYCTPCESFWTDSQLDENGCCPECHRPVTMAKEEAYFFKMSPFADRIEKLLLETDYLRPKTRAIELVNNFIKPGLEDLCVSRTTFKWGIPVSFDEGHIVYVWIDALSNYITALGYENSRYNDFDHYWANNGDGEVIHMVAKDIMRFHAIIWPAMLMALDLPLPDHLAVHGWITFNGEKMSKSLGNGIDPLEVIDEYGADALRFMLATGNSPGNDMRYMDDKVKAARNFANKLWNASRFIMMNLPDDFEFKGLPENLNLEDKWLISKFNKLAKEVNDNLSGFELGIASTKIYDFIWDIYCDWYIELTKPRIQAGGETKATAQAVLVWAMQGMLKLLHPFMPFITEEIWQVLTNGASMIMLEDYPVFDESLSFENEEKSFEKIIAAVKAVRNTRTDMNVPPSVKAKLFIETADAELFNSCSVFFEKLASASSVEIGDKFDIPDSANAVTDSARIFIPMNELVDKEKELARLDKERAKVQKDIDFLSGKLSNQGFIAKAPEKLIEAEKAKLAKAEEKMAKIMQSIEKYK